MDRRRFVPSPEGLEGRQLLSNALGLTRPKTLQSVTYATLAQKTDRIAHLPFFLNSVETRRFLPKDLLTQLQADLTAIRGKLHAASPTVLNAFNVDLRKITQNFTLTAENVRVLNADFGRALTSAGAAPEQVARLQEDMINLAKVDANSPNPNFLATNDYSIVLQVALGVGRPIQTPAAPHLNVKDRVATQNASLTPNAEPHLTGNYTAGTTINLIDNQGKVLGTAAVPVNRVYTVSPSSPLSVGRHDLRVFAQDAAGDISLPSAVVPIQVIARGSASHPQGPAALGSGATTH